MRRAGRRSAAGSAAGRPHGFRRQLAEGAGIAAGLKPHYAGQSKLKRLRAIFPPGRTETSPMLPKPPHPLSHSMLKPNAFGLRHTETHQPQPIALSEAQMCAVLAASHPLPPAARSAFLQHS
jgi:hypothetical protein